MKLSFIIIGQNEGQRLQKCLNSVFNTIRKFDLQAEVIYVDSRSIDDSVTVAKTFKACRVMLITGRCNPAIARNIGAKEAIGKGMIFLDADMELISDFIPEIIDTNLNLKYEFVSGNFMNYYYSPSGQLLNKDYYRKIYCKEDTYQATTGGLFAIDNKLWQKFGGMNPVFRKGQDLELGYRLANSGHMLLRKKELMAIHHTISYKNLNRLWQGFFNGANILPRAILYRSHLSNKFVLKRILSSDPTLLILALNLILTLIMSDLKWMSIYVTILPMALFLSLNKNINKDFILRLLIHFLKDLQNLLAFFLYFPSTKIDYEYKKV